MQGTPSSRAKTIFDAIFLEIRKFFNAHSMIIQSRKELEEICGRLNFIDEQMKIIAQENKDKMTEMVATVKVRVSNALQRRNHTTLHAR
ncbi:Uncharacterised protein g11044 [Pycnogonum litorale]